MGDNRARKWQYSVRTFKVNSRTAYFGLALHGHTLNQWHVFIYGNRVIRILIWSGGQGRLTQYINAVHMAEIMKSKRTLMESDIPGASLNGKSPRGLTIPQLKRWLQCQNASLKGKKANLVARSVPGSWSGSQRVMCM